MIPSHPPDSDKFYFFLAGEAAAEEAWRAAWVRDQLDLFVSEIMWIL